MVRSPRKPPLFRDALTLCAPPLSTLFAGRVSPVFVRPRTCAPLPKDLIFSNFSILWCRSSARDRALSPKSAYACVCVCVCVCAAPPQELFLCVTDTEPLQPQAYSVRGALPWTTAGTLKGRASPPGVLSAALARAAPASSKTSRRLNLPPPCLLRSNGKRNSDAYFHLVD